MNKFQSFLGQIWTDDTASLIESIQSAYGAIFEARVLPEVTLHDGEGSLGFHEYRVADKGNTLIYQVGTVDKEGKPLNMNVQFNNLPLAFGGDLGQLTMVNFTDGDNGFNVTGRGSLDSFNSVFSIIKMVNPEGIYFKATDDNTSKSAQKSRIYAGYLQNMGYTKVPQEELTPHLQKAGGEVFTR
jgi:hypothetical protein